MTKPAMKLVAELMQLVRIASLEEEQGVVIHGSTFLASYVLVNIVVEFIIRRVGEQDSETRSQREEDLSRCIHPHLSFINSIEIRTEIVHDAHGGTGQSDASDEQGNQDHVREEGGEPDDCDWRD